MFRIRFHGRGGQGMKTASRILGTAFFLEGFEVQDAPRYGAERRGAPIFAFVRADSAPIHERGVIAAPDLVVVADETLVGIPAAGVLQGVDNHTQLLIAGRADAETWRQRLQTRARILTLPQLAAEDPAEERYVGATCAGAAACLVGVIPEATMEEAIAQELATHGPEVVAENGSRALAAYELVAEDRGAVIPFADGSGPPVPPRWIDLPLDGAELAAPAIHAAATSLLVRTGLWRSHRPVLDAEKCNRCAWICGSFCPDGVIGLDVDGYPVVDLDHCKGCLVCVAQCPTHALVPVPEIEASESQGGPP